MTIQLPTTPAEIEVLLDDIEEHWTGDAAFDRSAARFKVLTDSGTFDRLGECMVACNGRGTMEYDDINRLAQWLRKASMPRPVCREFAIGQFSFGHHFNSDDFAHLCGKYSVPCVVVEVGVVWDRPPAITEAVRWDPPSPALAAAVLREAATFPRWFDLLAQEGPFIHRRLPPIEQLVAYSRANEAASDAVRQHHPDAVAFRLRLGASGEWHERRL